MIRRGASPPPQTSFLVDFADLLLWEDPVMAYRWKVQLNVLSGACDTSGPNFALGFNVMCLGAMMLAGVRLIGGVSSQNAPSIVKNSGRPMSKEYCWPVLIVNVVLGFEKRMSGFRSIVT